MTFPAFFDMHVIRKKDLMPPYGDEKEDDLLIKVLQVLEANEEQQKWITWKKLATRELK